MVADHDGTIMGAVWVRVLPSKLKGYPIIDDQAPQFAISVKQEYRNQGIGTVLMDQMIQYLKKKGYAQAALHVDKTNYALKWYQRLGFVIAAENEDDYIMVLNLT